MKRELLPYYLSRAALSALPGAVVGLNSGWLPGVIIGALVFAGFIWYAHSGRYLVDTSRPLFPLRRDARGEVIRDRAVVWAVAVGGVAYGLLALAGMVFSLPASAGIWALLAGVVTYFAVSNWLYARS